MLDALEDRGIEDAWRSPSRSRAVGLDADWVERVQAIAGPATQKALAWVAASLTAHELASELVESTERMSQLVKAIKTYAYMDRGGVVKADVHEGLESTLIMLGHKLKHTQIKVKRDYDKSLPKLIDVRLRAQPGLDEPARQRDRRARRDGHDHGLDAARQRLRAVDIADDGPGIPGTPARTSSIRSSPPRPPAAAPAWGSTPRGGSSSSATAARSRSTPDEGTTFHVWLPVRR